jgi:hypothetical protein
VPIISASVSWLILAINGSGLASALEKAISESSAMIVYVGRLGVQAWVDREVRLGLELKTKTPQAFRLIPVLGEYSDPSSLPPFLSQQQVVDVRDGQRAPEQIRRLTEVLKAPSSQSAIPSEYWATNSPFRNLAVFQPQDSWLFLPVAPTTPAGNS